MGSLKYYIISFILQTHTTVSAIITSTFASTVSLILMSRVTADYIIGFVFPYTLAFNNI